MTFAKSESVAITFGTFCMLLRLSSEHRILLVRVTMAAIYTLVLVGLQNVSFFPLGLKWRNRDEILLKYINPPVCLALTHTHAHSKVCGNSTFGASPP